MLVIPHGSKQQSVVVHLSQDSTGSFPGDPATEIDVALLRVSVRRGPMGAPLEVTYVDFPVDTDVHMAGSRAVLGHGNVRLGLPNWLWDGGVDAVYIDVTGDGVRQTRGSEVVCLDERTSSRLAPAKPGRALVIDELGRSVVDVNSIAGQGAIAAGPVTFPRYVGSSNYAGGDHAGLDLLRATLAQLQSELAALAVGGGIGGGIGGIGDHLLTITVTSAGGAVAGATVTAQTSAGVRHAVGQTDATGAVQFGASEDTYTLLIKAAGHELASSTVVVDGANATTTVTLTALSIPAPSAPDYATGYLYTVDAAGELKPGTDVFIMLMDPTPGLAATGLGWVPNHLKITSDAVTALAAKSLPRGRAYRVRIGLNGAWSEAFTVPTDPLITQFQMPEVFGRLGQ